MGLLQAATARENQTYIGEEMGLKGENHRSGKELWEWKIHFSLFVLLIFAVICAFFWLEAAFHPAAWLLHLNFYHLCESLHIWAQNRSPVGWQETFI